MPVKGGRKAQSMNQKVILIPADGFRPDALTTWGILTNTYIPRVRPVNGLCERPAAVPAQPDICDIAPTVTQLPGAAAARE